MFSKIESKYAFRLVRSTRKTCAIEIKANGDIVVRAPLYMSGRMITEFVNSKRDWIDNSRQRLTQKQKQREELDPISPADLKILANKASIVIPAKVKYYADIIGVTYGRITVRNQKTRWGSCSSTGNLNFNCLLMLTPEEVLDYVIVHELCHRKHMNHSKDFWREVEKVIPEYKTSYAWLKNHGGELIHRMCINK